MKHFVKFMIAALFLFSIAALAYAIHEIIPSETTVPLPGPNAEALNEYIIRYSPYRSWELWPGKGRLYPGKEPHGSLLTTFVNDTAFFGIKKKTGMSDGAIIAKENYSAEKKFSALTVMYKIKGYNPGAGDWFWAKYAPDGKVLASGKVAACIECHSLKAENDFLYSGTVK
jgi:hypothetical protein